jgi:hypothetical protein
MTGKKQPGRDRDMHDNGHGVNGYALCAMWNMICAGLCVFASESKPINI